MRKTGAHDGRLWPVAGGCGCPSARLQVADVVAALVLPLRGRLRLGDDVVHLQGPLVLGLLSISLAPQYSLRPRVLGSTRSFSQPLVA